MKRERDKQSTNCEGRRESNKGGGGTSREEEEVYEKRVELYHVKYYLRLPPPVEFDCVLSLGVPDTGAGSPLESQDAVEDGRKRSLHAAVPDVTVSEERC